MGDIQLTIFQLGTSHTHTTQHPQKPSQLELLLSIPQTFAINPCVAILWGLIYKTLLLLLHLFIYFRSKVSVQWKPIEYSNGLERAKFSKSIYFIIPCEIQEADHVKLLA